MRTWLRPWILTVAGALAVLLATGITAACGGDFSSSVVSSSTTATHGAKPNSKPASTICEQLIVPAYFSAPYWQAVIRLKDKPGEMILNVDGFGAGNAPEPQLQRLVKQAQDAGITVLGYSSTADGQRPAAQVEADVRNYAAWYNVTSIFLDRASGTAKEFPYYSQLTKYIRAADKGGQIWLNPGVYPDDQNYMSLGDVVMVFEGTYAQYLTTPVPGWAKHYPPGRFSHTIYAAPAAVLQTALKMAQQRNARHVFITDLVGSNPYQGLPSYWPAEAAAAVAGCSGS